MFKSIISISGLLIYSLLFSVNPLAADGVISYFDGDVFISRGADEIFADFGSEIENGDVIETGEASTAIIEMSSGSRLKLKENTVIVFDDNSSETRISLVEGALFSKINRLAGKSYSVKTPTAVAGVRGTEFFMAFGRTVEEAPDLWLCVNEGTVEVQIPDTGDSVLVDEGEGISIFGGRRLSDPKYYAWTDDLNWNSDPAAGPIADATSLDGAYTDLLNQDYF